MPIDIASGRVELDFDDISIPGKVQLIWDRHYNTAFLDRPNTPIGKGWTTRYFATLTQKSDGFEFVTPKGGIEFLEDSEGLVQRGEHVFNFGAFLEIFKDSQHYIVQHWDVETGDVWRYSFSKGQPGTPWPLVSVEDITGQVLDLTWNSNGKLAGIRQRLEKRTLILHYNPAGLINAIIFQPVSGGRHVLARYEYNAQGQLIAAYDAAGNADRYEYDRQGRLAREIVKDGGVFTYCYDDKGRCVKSGGLDRYDEKRLRFLDATGITELTNSYDQTSYYQHLPSGQIVQEVDPLGNKRSTNYDDYGRIIAKTDATGAITRYRYDEYGNRACIIDALGNTHTFNYNSSHLPVSMTDPLGQVWQRTYDSANRLIGTQDPLGNKWLIRYDTEGNLVEIQNPLGAHKYQQYSQGMLNAITDWMGNVIHFRIDDFGRVTERQGTFGEITRICYDVLGNPIKVIYPDGATLHANYDNVGNLTSFIDGNGRITRFGYGPCRRLLERIDPVGGMVRYIWGSEPRRLEQVINENGETYTFFHDESGRIIREQSFDGAERQFQYDSEGYTTGYINANGEKITLQRDLLHRVIEYILPDGEHVTYSFDPFGNLINAVNVDIAVAFERDSLGRIVSEKQDSHWVESLYDNVGNLIQTKTSLGHKVDYELDANGFVNTLTTTGNQKLKFKRNTYGQETMRQMPGGVVMEQRYDDLGRLIEQRVEPGHLSSSERVSIIPPRSEMIRRIYTYDLNGSLTSIVDGYWGRIDYIYDPAERLLKVLREQGSNETFSYDRAGNINRVQIQDKSSIDELLVYGSGNRLLRKGNTIYEYDAEGRRIKKIEAVDSDNPQIWLFQWDALDQLKTIIRPDGEIWNYKYDALKRRIKKIGLDKEINFIWNLNVPICELSLHDKNFKYWLFGPNSFIPLGQLKDDKIYSIITDHLGTPREMLNCSGHIVWQLNMKPYGAKNFELSKDSTCPFRFQGQYYDDESGLHYNRHRYYDPDIGVFTSQDPLGLSGGLNFYCYGQNPIGWIDPLGLTTEYPTLAEVPYVRNYGDELVAMSKPSTKPHLLKTHTYVNPGHHDPSSTNYISTKAILPENHIDLFLNSVPVEQGGKVTRWTKEGAGRNAVYHRFDQHSDGEYHWNGSTKGVTKKGKPREIAEHDVPSCVK